jgi:hypothetical protein
MYQLSGVSKIESCDVNVIVILPNADSGCAGPASVKVLVLASGSLNARRTNDNTIGCYTWFA